MSGLVTIRRVHFAKGLSAFYFDDQAAIKTGARQDGFVYEGQPQTVSFDAIRQRGESVSIMLELSDGQMASGDCTAVQYSGAAGRDRLFRADQVIAVLRQHLAPLLIGRNVSSFRTSVAFVDSLEENEALSHKAILYGLSQALLDATAKASYRTMCETVCDEWGLSMVAEALALFGQSGDDRYAAVDKMILKSVSALPHGLINNVPEKLGQTGEKLVDYVRWLSHRVRALRTDPGYCPDLHIDVYGTIGLIFDDDVARIANYLLALENAAEPFRLYVEGPVDAGSKSGQIALLGAIRRELKDRGSSVKLVADEWCNTLEDVIDFAAAGCCDMVQIKTPDLGGIHNTIEAVLTCKKYGVEAYQGGSCNETDISARACVHVAMATRPERILVKPGMGFDEGMTIVSNEMHRILAVHHAKSEIVA